MKDTDQPQPEVAPQSTNAASSAAATSAAMTDALVDRSKFIRTMAKDMATLSGTPAPAAPAAPAKEPEEKREETFSGVTLEKPEQPFFEKARPLKEERAEEPLELPALSPMPSAPALPPDAERAAVLERLKLKAQASAAASAPASTVPEAPVVAWPSIPPPPPSFAPPAEPAPERLPPVGKESYREPIEEYAPPAPRTPASNDPLHTYKSDFADRIDAKGASTFSVLAAEQDSGAKPVAAPAPSRPPARAILAIASGILLLVLAGGGIFATYRFVMTMRDTPVAALSVPSIVVADEYRELSGSGTELMEALRASAASVLIPGNVLVTYIVEQTADGEGKLLAGPAGGDVFIRALALPAPDILLRNIARESTIGAISAGGQEAPFFALRVDSYERTYAGMLTWEPLMLRDLEILFPLYPAQAAPVQPVATTTASTTTPAPSVPVQATALTRFEDVVVANHDVRVLRDTQGRSLILYGYTDKRTLLIVRDEAAFEALLERLKSE